MSNLPSLPEEEGFWAPKISAEPFNLKDIMVRASIARRVERIGPPSSDLLSSFTAMKKWSEQVVQHFQGSGSLKHARAQNERLISILLQSPSSKYDHVKSYGSAEAPPKLGMNSAQISGSSYIFIGSNVFLGLVPFGTQVGDLICQFWNSTASVVVRRTRNNGYEVVGRASVVQHGESLDWDVPIDYGRFVDRSKDLLDLKVDLRIMTALSLDTIDMPYYS